jgi:SET domain
MSANKAFAPKQRLKLALNSEIDCERFRAFCRGRLQAGRVCREFSAEFFSGSNPYDHTDRRGASLDHGWKFSAFVNHACEPNSVFDVTRLAFVAAKPIAVGDEITFNYLTTESEMFSPFDSSCGSSKCYGLIRGNHFLPTQSPEVAIR